MLGYIIKRLCNAVVVLWVVITITFGLMHAIPGGPFTTEKNLPPQVMANIEARYKLNDPLYKQYTDYLVNITHGDLGPSFKYQGRTVNDIIKESFPVSFRLGMDSIFLAILIGIPAGVFAALKRGKWQDRVINFFTTLGVAVPSFVLAALFIEVFALKLGLLPAAMWGGWKNQILPAVALAGMPMAFITRLTRSSMIDVLGQDYIKTAKAKGLSALNVLFRHVHRPDGCRHPDGFVRHRVHLRDSGPRPLLRHVDLQPRLHGHPRRHDLLQRSDHPHEHARGFRLSAARSAHQTGKEGKLNGTDNRYGGVCAARA